MQKWLEYDPLTGVQETNYASDDDNKVVVTKEQDVQPLLDRNAELRNSKATDIGIKKGLWHYASIPVTVQYELLKKGINIHRLEDHAKMFAIIESEYPYLKTTDKRHLLNSHRPSATPKAEISTPRGPSLIVR